MSYSLTLIEGDGIGPEVVRATKNILHAAGLAIAWDEKLLGLKAIEKFGVVLPEETLQSIKKNTVALKGPTTTPVGGGHQSANVALRKALDLYACVRPVKSIPGISRFADVDLVIFRENTEGLYTGQEFEVQPGCVISLRTMTKKGCSRIANAAFSFASIQHRKKLTAVHKANILKMGDGLLLDCVQAVHKEYSDIIYDDCIIDALCMKLVMKPESFDVLLLENMFGDIVSDLCAGLVGGLGLVPGANIGDQYAVFEAVHGTAPDIAGQNVANPTAMIKSAIMMLNHLGEKDAAENIEQALLSVLQQKPLITKDLGGNASTKEFSEHVIYHLK